MWTDQKACLNYIDNNNDATKWYNYSLMVSEMNDRADWCFFFAILKLTPIFVYDVLKYFNIHSYLYCFI